MFSQLEFLKEPHRDRYFLKYGVALAFEGVVRFHFQLLDVSLLENNEKVKINSLIYKRGGNPDNLPAIPKQATMPSRIPSIINMSLSDSSFESGTLVSFKRLKLIL